MPTTHKSPVNGFSAYADTLEHMALSGIAQPRARINAALDGEAYRELRRLVTLPVRRQYGAFFTSTRLASRLLARQEEAEFHHDPSCGVGDLLLAAARHFPLEDTFDKTLVAWSKRLFGRDLHVEFIRATKARLILLARTRGNFSEPLKRSDLGEVFPKFSLAMDFRRDPYPVGLEWS